MLLLECQPMQHASLPYHHHLSLDQQTQEMHAIEPPSKQSLDDQ
jgi:hypothetical protein